MKFLDVDRLRKEGDAIPSNNVCQRACLDRGKYWKWKEARIKEKKLKDDVQKEMNGEHVQSDSIYN